MQEPKIVRHWADHTKAPGAFVQTSSIGDPPVKTETTATKSPRNHVDDAEGAKHSKRPRWLTRWERSLEESVVAGLCPGTSQRDAVANARARMGLSTGRGT
ncbi:hypothetical protein ASPCADRAFT_4214 [Aspergillus carbonarius ITEM 5010]|uniref:Uncharacterized protein n=1 Tax=Aspergillus carbonarius (strain ITEM 5010) TaxID=602072 RepID=A0A1R3RSY5_ASPC5|nr:hypothetical protein ASPCADRAFT_4214 [Aspergillus carbonarius ITEM 5010]